jgi:hypothetical protein
MGSGGEALPHEAMRLVGCREVTAVAQIRWRLHFSRSAFRRPTATNERQDP